ncbi:hypothetical protein ACFWFZ_21840 [Streptomyces sp. NPDC060232]|uniref:hypothetical protein n=1 Tax=Streptomyces sp. NPDC060232 TaxID=3347079 RepID=UPI003667E989
MTYATVRRLNRSAPGVKLTGLMAVGVMLCAVVATAALASRSVTLGFVVGAGLAPPVQRWILRRRRKQ